MAPWSHGGLRSEHRAALRAEGEKGKRSRGGLRTRFRTGLYLTESFLRRGQLQRTRERRAGRLHKNEGRKRCARLSWNQTTARRYFLCVHHKIFETYNLNPLNNSGNHMLIYNRTGIRSSSEQEKTLNQLNIMVNSRLTQDR